MIYMLSISRLMFGYSQLPKLEAVILTLIGIIGLSTLLFCFVNLFNLDLMEKIK